MPSPSLRRGVRGRVVIRKQPHPRKTLGLSSVCHGSSSKILPHSSFWWSGGPLVRRWFPLFYCLLTFCATVRHALSSCLPCPITLSSMTASFMVNMGKAHGAARNVNGYSQQMRGYPSHRINKRGYFSSLKIVILFFFKTLKYSINSLYWALSICQAKSMLYLHYFIYYS